MKQSRLQSQVVPASDLSAGQASALFAIFARHYECVDYGRFRYDLSEKDFVILLSDAETGEPRGFSTQKILSAVVSGVPVRAIFSGDTIIDRTYWGEQELVRSWCRFAGQVHMEDPRTRLYWFLISKGYRTYLYLPLFFREFYPRYDTPTPRFEQEVMAALARKKFPSFYNPQSGLLEFPESQGQLTPDLAAIPPGRRDDPHVRFFLSRNPRFAEGVELVCLAEISSDNMRSLAARMMREGERFGHLFQESSLYVA